MGSEGLRNITIWKQWLSNSVFLVLVVLRYNIQALDFSLVHTSMSFYKCIHSRNPNPSQDKNSSVALKIPPCSFIVSPFPLSFETTDLVYVLLIETTRVLGTTTNTVGWLRGWLPSPQPSSSLHLDKFCLFSVLYVGVLLNICVGRKIA